MLLAALLLTVSCCIIFIGLRNTRFQRDTAREVRALLAHGRSPAPARPVRDDDLDSLPPPVARWLRRAGVVGRSPARIVRLHQRGQLRLAPDQPFVAAEADEVINTEVPGFVWNVCSTTRRVVPLCGRDSYLGGHGHQRVLAAGVVPMLDASGAEADQGALLRFLAELVWFPAAALAPYLHWRAFDDHVAEATMSHHGVSLSARFFFDAQGRVTGIAARRYLGGGTAARLERWELRVEHWQRWSGVEVPSHGAMEWKLPEGDFEHYRWMITDLEYDPPAASWAHPAHRATALQTDVIAVRG